MKNIYWYQSHVFSLDFTESFLGLLEMKSCEHGLRTDIILSDSETDEEILIGTIISGDFDIKESYEYGCNMMRNEEYCMDIWNGRRKHNK